MSILRIALATLALAACAKTSVPSPTVTADDAAAASGTPDATAPQAKAAASARGSCTARSELTSAAGEKISCYPYRCRDGACLHACQSSEDCAGSRGPAELAAEGWPLECLGKNECVPLPPHAVKRQLP
ncbi:MAG TPA: hypothetical protein VLT33_45405 [Labilithrix sp.]|nr:hypothetical protein [Labilithrix sp.]